MEGRVGGEVVSVGGSVRLGPNAVVDGNVTSVGGSIKLEPGATINGSTHEVDPPWARTLAATTGISTPPSDRSRFFGASVESLRQRGGDDLRWASLACLTLLIARRRPGAGGPAAAGRAAQVSRWSAWPAFSAPCR